MKDKLIELAQLRQERDTLKTERDEAREAMMKTIEAQEWEELDGKYKALSPQVSAAEASIKDSVVSAFDGTNRRPTEGVEIKLYTTIRYYKKDKDLEEWARENLSGVLKLDKKRFEAAVKAGVVSSSVAEALKEPRASIKRDLGFLLEEQT